MPDAIFSSLYNDTVSTITLLDFGASIACSLVLGVWLAFACSYRSGSSSSFSATLALMPSAAAVVIMMVSENLGAGVAVAGAFSLVRYRSAPGTAREICAIFITMACGLAVGMGYLGFAALFSVIMGLAMIASSVWVLGHEAAKENHKLMRVTVPEDLDYGGIFDDLFETHTTSHRLTCVKTTNLGSLNKLTYEVVLRDASDEKPLIDAMRCRNGNLEISCSCCVTTPNEL